ncbi:MAG: photosynthetic complex putative assembly protein PuhB [Pseudomonadota bacterium]
MAQDEFQVEPVRGLPEALPDGEHILWQGRPAVWPLARASMSVRLVAGYFALLAAWRGVAIGLEHGQEAGLWAASWYVMLGVLATLILLAMAVVFARTTVYTLTTHRVAMRVGAALTITLNLPYRWIAKADLAMERDGTGSIYLDLKGSTRFSYLVLWPHVKPWVMNPTQPTLRAIPDARRVAEILGRAAEQRVAAITSELEPERSAAAVAAE